MLLPQLASICGTFAKRTRSRDGTRVVDEQTWSITEHTVARRRKSNSNLIGLVTAATRIVRDLSAPGTPEPLETVLRAGAAYVNGKATSTVMAQAPTPAARAALGTVSTLSIQALTRDMAPAAPLRWVLEDTATASMASGIEAGLELFGLLNAELPPGPARRVFISHSWRRDTRDYAVLVARMRENGYSLYDHSIPAWKALDTETDPELDVRLSEKIRRVSVVVVLASPGVERRRWVRREVELADEHSRRVVVVRPHGLATHPLPAFLRDSRYAVVGFNAPAVIRRVAGG